MERISDLEKKYVNEALENAFATSKNSIFNLRLEKEFAEKFGMKYAIGSINGTATLHQAVAALGIKPGDEVIAPALTMASSSFGIVMAGVNPVFADSDRETFQISAESIEKCITPKTKAVMTVALYGFCPDYDKIIEICKKHNLYLIEDNAEAFGAKYKGKLVGTFGDFSSFSFQASKHLTTGEGGMLLTNNLEFADEARRFGCLGYGSVGATKQKITRNDIQDPAYFRHVSVGFNYRMSELQVALHLVSSSVLMNWWLTSRLAPRSLMRPSRVRICLSLRKHPKVAILLTGLIAVFSIPTTLRKIGMSSVTCSRRMVVILIMLLGSSLIRSRPSRTLFTSSLVSGSLMNRVFVRIPSTSSCA